MIIIIIGIVIFGIVCLMSVPVGLTGIILSILIPLFIPLEGYHLPECIKTIRLIKLRRPGAIEDRFIEEKGKKVIYACDNRELYQIDCEVYEETFVKGRIKIYKSKDCTTPLLKIFKVKPVRGDLAIVPFYTRKEYIFCIPENIQEIDEKNGAKTKHESSRVSWVG